MKYKEAIKLLDDAESLKGTIVTVVMPQPSGERRDEKYELVGSQTFSIGPAKEVGASTRKEEMTWKVDAVLRKEEGKWREIDKFPLQLVVDKIENGGKLFFNYFDQFEDN